MHVISVPLPQPFDFVSTVTDHGWYDLAPWRWRPDITVLERVERLHTGMVVLLTIWQDKDHLFVESTKKLDVAEAEAVKSGMMRSLRLDQDFDRFYKVAQTFPDQTLWESIRQGRGRLM